jgi:phosphoribosylformylglycinamidine synthase subunit PurQ / glutaminase
MGRIPKVIVLRTAGTNCDQETAFAFRHFGAEVDLVHINKLFKGEVKIRTYQILAVPGGFTYGDDIMSGKILANELRLRLGDDLKQFIGDGKLLLGICNGFQVFVRAGIFEDTFGKESRDRFSPTVTLTYNDSGKFEDRWTYLRVSGNSVWTAGLSDIVMFPVAHAEGKFAVRDEPVFKKLVAQGQVAFRYCTIKGESPLYPANPNGSLDNIAGITDRTGRILGLMPHPERHFWGTQHPFWTRQENRPQYGDGARIFENGLRFVRENLLK